MAAGLALTAILLALAALGWDPALALVRTAARQPGRRRLTVPDSSFAFIPPLLPPPLLLGLMAGAGALGIIGSAVFVQPVLLLITPLGVLGVRAAVLALATWWYSWRLRAQLLPALQSLTGLMEGGRTMLVAAFASVTPTLPEPLRGEWQWVRNHLNQPYTVTRSDGTIERFTSTHAAVLEQLAMQTPVRLHAQVLDQLVSIYTHQREAQAHERLTQITAALARHAALQRSVQTLLGRIRGEAYVISGAFAGILGWLAWSQPARFGAAFMGSDWGLLAGCWFGLWLVLPIVVALLVVRIPELPL
ncbi:MAG: hypothetical protein WCJ55_01390 [Chloroflexales bacterium]